MVVGHVALALAAKKKAPDLNLAWTVAAVTALDLIWPILILLGIERVTIAPGATAFTPLTFDSYPWSHSLETAFVWGFLLTLLAQRFGIPKRTAILLWPLVMSHWVLDLVTHAPDLPLWLEPGPKLGLGLWNSIPGTIIVEGAMWIAGIVLYLRVRPLRGLGNNVAFWSFVLFLTLVWISGPFTPPPPSVTALGWFGLCGWLLVPWAYWADRRPAPTSPQPS